MPMNAENLPQLVTPETSAFLQQAKEAAAEYARNSKAANTWRAYQADLRDFTSWCAAHNLSVLPADPATVAAYLVNLAPRRKVSTIQRRLASISQAHIAASFVSPTLSAAVRLTMQGIRRTHAPAQGVRKVAPAVTSVIARIVEPLTGSLIDVRDRALLLIGFAGAFRRSELAGLWFEDITETEDGLRILLRQSKTDQEGQGIVKGIPFGSDEKTCPVRAWRAWVAAAGIMDGQAFRSVGRSSERQIGAAISDRTIANMVKSRVKAAGFDPEKFSGHSLRSGLITAAARAGVPERVIMKQSRHKHLPTLREYIHEGSLFTENAAAKVGL
jgi:site-specific recombinase XerD